MHRIKYMSFYTAIMDKVKYIKFCFLILFVLSLLTSCKTENKKVTDWANKGLKGKVYAISEYHFLAKLEFDKVVRKYPDSIYEGIDTKKMAISLGLDSSLFNFPKEPLRGPLGYEENGTFYFNKEGFVARQYTVSNKGMISDYHCFYDSKNRINKEVYLDSVNGYLTAKDKKNNTWFKKTARVDDSIVYKNDESYHYKKEQNNPKYLFNCKKKYDANGNVIEEIKYLPSGETLTKRVCIYDPIGRIVSDILYDSDGVLNKILTKYENNQIITDNDSFQTIETFIDSTYNRKISEVNLYGTQLWKYDDKGNVIYWQRGDADFSYKYEYDSEGNWIKRVKYNVKYNTPEELTEREIHYYSNNGFNKNIIYFIIGAFFGLGILISIWYLKKNKK